MNEDRDFNKDNFKGACPKVPQQPNFSDCGLFALQYAESFFKNPISDYSLPITNLRKWFKNDLMREKRSFIAKIIRDLATEQNPKQKIEFPNITFTPDSGSGYTDDEEENSISLSKQAKPKFFVKSNSTTAPPRVICLTTSQAGKILGTPTKTAVNSPGMLIQKRKGKIEYFTMGAKNKPKIGNHEVPKLPSKINSVGAKT